MSLFDEISKATPQRGRKFSKRDFSRARLGFDNGPSGKSSYLNLSNFSKIWNSLPFIVIVLMFFFVFLAKTFTLQLINGGDNRLLAEGNRIRITNIMAERGLLLDRNSQVLIRNKPAFSLEMDTERCRISGMSTCRYELKMFSSNVLPEDLIIDEQRIDEDFESGRGIIILKTGLTKEEILSIEANLGQYPSFAVRVSPQRDYLYSDAFAHVLGYVGFGDTLYPTIEGKSGVEAFYDSYLTGVDGGEVVQVDSSGKKINILSKRKAIPGKDLILSLDLGLQNLAYDLLKEKVDADTSDNTATAGVVVAQDPYTGAVLALVSYPSFDPNIMIGGLSQEEYSVLINDPSFPFFNRALSGTYPPASTFKMIMASAALAENIVEPSFSIIDKGFIQVGSYIFNNWNKSGHGEVDLRRALQVSNDTYFYTVGGGYGGIKGLGIEKIAKWAKKFGFGSLTGIDLAGEVAGFVPDGEYRDWYLGDTYISSIGQGDMLATPLQVNNMTAYFANGGYLYSPKVLYSADGVTGDVEVLSQNLISKEDYSIIREGMNLAVKPGGTGYPFFDFPDKYGVEVAGKTGTAEFGSVDNETTHAWFTVFGPYFADSSPEISMEHGIENGIALTVFLEEGGGGSDDAAPIARKLFDYWFSR